MLYIFTGSGKGKTTAALGQAVRAVGEGKRVLMVQFIKGPWKSGEDKVEILCGELSSPQSKKGAFKLVKMGKGFVGIMGDKLPRGEHQKAAEEALAFARKEMESDPPAGGWDMIILDEINNAVSLNLVSKEKVWELINSLNSSTHLILTGRDAPPEFLEKADLVTEMREIKHPFAQGTKGKRGLEY